MARSVATERSRTIAPPKVAAQLPLSFSRPRNNRVFAATANRRPLSRRRSDECHWKFLRDCLRRRNAPHETGIRFPVVRANQLGTLGASEINALDGIVLEKRRQRFLRL